MKVCIVALGNELNSQVSPRFGRAPFFIILNEEGEIEEALKNPGVRAMRGAGVAAAQEISSRGVGALVCGNVGPNAFGALAAANIKIFSIPAGISVKEAFNKWKEDKLTLVEAPRTFGGFGRGSGPGRGQRRGRRGGP